MNVDYELEKTIRKLQKLRIKLKDVEKIEFDHEGEQILNLISKLETDGDVVELARQIVDGVVPGTSEYEEFNRIHVYEDVQEWMDEMIEDRKEQEELHRYYTDPTPDEEEDRSSFEEKSVDYVTIVHEMIDEAGLSGYWLTVNEFLREVGYPEFETDHPFEIEDLIELLNNLDDGEEDDSDLLVLEKFLNHELETDSNDFLMFISELLGQCGNSEENFKYSPKDYNGTENVFFADEESAEVDDYEDTLRKVVLESLSYLKEEIGDDGTFDKIDEGGLQEMSLEELEDLHEEIDDYIDEEEDREEKISRKRQRDEFDEQAVLAEAGMSNIDYELDEIRFEQNNTDFCINPTAFKMLCKEIVQDFIEREEFTFEPGFYEALQTASEDFLIKKFQASNLVALTDYRTHIQTKDIQTVSRIVKTTKGPQPDSYK